MDDDPSVAVVMSAVSIVPAVDTSSDMVIASAVSLILSRVVALCVIALGGGGLGSFDFFEKKENRRRPTFLLVSLLFFPILRLFVVLLLLLVIHGEAEEDALLFTGLDWELAILMFRSLLGSEDGAWLRKRGRRSHAMVASSFGVLSFGGVV